MHAFIKQRNKKQEMGAHNPAQTGSRRMFIVFFIWASSRENLSSGFATR